jgi:hypothetical protein
MGRIAMNPISTYLSTIGAKGGASTSAAKKKAARANGKKGGRPKKNVLRLTLKRRWFNMIAGGDKKEEYRTPGKWILSRLEGKAYDRIEFKNGYGPNVPTMEVEYLGWAYSFGKHQWGAGDDELVVIRLGRVLSLHNK